MKINQILCPIDFSRLSTVAIDRASQLAKQFGARLHIVHIYEPIFTDEFGNGSIPPADLESIEVELEDHRPTEPSVDCCHELIYGLPASSIVGYARTHNIDLIVMGTHGRTGFRHTALGSVAESVVRSADCAVMTVHEQPVPVAAT